MEFLGLELRKTNEPIGFSFSTPFVTRDQIEPPERTHSSPSRGSDQGDC